jgi:carnitine monooxygenase subunit
MSATITDATLSVPLRVTDPERIPTERYYDPAFFELEKQHLWPRVWQMACRLEEIPAVGDYVEYTILDKSVIVVRGRAGVRAFKNACSHRGVRLANGPGNCAAKGFVCPFHGWRFSAEGECTFVYGKSIFSERLLDPDEINLVPVRCEEWAGCAFINFDNEAPPLLDCLGPVVQRLNARHVDKLKMDWWYGTILPTNWKLAMEAFMEGYHVMRTHPQLETLSPAGPIRFGPDVDAPERAPLDARGMVNMNIDFMKRLSDGMAGMVHHTEVAVLEKLRDMEVPDDPGEAMMAFYARAQEEITRDGLARGAPMFDIARVNAENEFHDVEFMFPHFFLLPSFSAMSSYRVRPLTPETCFFEIWSLVLRPEGEPYDTPSEPIVLAYDSPQFPEIPMQDYSNLPIQQLGLHNFPYMRLSHSWEGLISNYQRLVDGFLAGLDREVLRKAENTINQGYDAPIRDIGF